MPAPRRNGRFQRDNRYNSRMDNRRMVQTQRNNTRNRAQTPRQRDRRISDNMEDISRQLIRLLRREPKRRAAHFPVDLATGSSISLAEVLRHPTCSEYGITEEQLDALVPASDPAKKLRFDAYTTSGGQRRVRAFNGHSLVGIIPPESDCLPLSSQFAIHGANVEASHAIAMRGFRLIGDRNDLHFIDSTYSAIQLAYVRGVNRKSVWITTDVRKAEALGCSFLKFTNEVIVSSRLNGFIPCSAIDSFRSSKRRCLDHDALKASPPQLIPIPTPAYANPPAQTDGDPSAEYLVGLGSNADATSPSRHSSPPPNQTKFDDRPGSCTDTSKSSPPTPILGAKVAPSKSGRSATPVRLPVPSSRGQVGRNSPMASAPLPSTRDRDGAEGSHASVQPSGRPTQRDRRENYKPTPGGWKRHQTYRSRTPRRDAPKLRPNAETQPQISVATPEPGITMPMFSDAHALQEHIQRAVQAEVLKTTLTAAIRSAGRYGPPVLTQNDSGNTTPRSTATKKPLGGTQDEDAHSQDDYQPPTVEACLYQAYRINRDFRVWGIPPFPEDDFKKDDNRKEDDIKDTRLPCETRSAIGRHAETTQMERNSPQNAESCSRPGTFTFQVFIFSFHVD